MYKSCSTSNLVIYNIASTTTFFIYTKVGLSCVDTPQLILYSQSGGSTFSIYYSYTPSQENHVDSCIRGYTQLLFALMDQKAFIFPPRQHQTVPDTSLYLRSGSLERGDVLEVVYGAHFICSALLLLLWPWGFKLI